MLITLNGIVVGERIVGENSSFLDIFTDKLGLVEVMAHGVKKVGGKNSSSASLFSYARFCLKKSGNRYTINSTEPICSFYNISSSIEALSLAAYFAEVIRYCATSEEEHSELLRFVCMTYYQLSKQKLSLQFIKAVFEFRFITHIGFMPDLRACRECICYTHERMYFLPNDGFIICSDCYDEISEVSSDAFQLNPTVLHTLRYVAYSPEEKLFNFKISPENERYFAAVTEYYLLTQLNRSFPTLEYYKNITLNQF